MSSIDNSEKAHELIWDAYGGEGTLQFSTLTIKVAELVFVNGYIEGQSAHLDGVYPGEGETLLQASQDALNIYIAAKECTTHNWKDRSGEGSEDPSFWCDTCNKPLGQDTSTWTESERESIRALDRFFGYYYPSV